MTVKSNLRDTLLTKIQYLPAEKLAEVSRLLSKIENQLRIKEKTLKLAGSWRKMDEDVFAGLTTQLHENRANDRRIE